MKNIFRILVMCSIGMTTQLGLFGQSGVAFQHIKWEQALEKSAAENKLIFLDAYASWCRPCKMLVQSTFPDQQLGDFMNEHFINLKIDMEKGEGRLLSRQYGVTAYPTLLFINSKGEIVRKLVGYRDAPTLYKSAMVIQNAVR